MKKIFLILCTSLAIITSSCENKGNVGNTKGVLYDTAISGRPTDTIVTDTENSTNGPDNAPPHAPDSSGANRNY